MAFDGLSLPEVSAADPYGAVTLSFREKVITFRFSWEAIRQLQELYGEGFLQEVAEGLDNRNVSRLAEIAAITSELTESEVMTYSPPILPLAKALNRAWQAAWMGPGVKPDFDEEALPDAPEGKPTRQRWWSRLWNWRSPAASPMPSSGG